MATGSSAAQYIAGGLLKLHWIPKHVRGRGLLASQDAMPRYFFNLTNGIRTVVDADGVQLEDEEAMRLEALDMVVDLRKEGHITQADWSGWRVIVHDENGCECFEAKF
jgi:hypothetical protein